MKKYSVFLLEDDIDLANLTAEFLSQFEFEYKIFNQVDGFKDAVLSQQPDLILLDVMLPDGDGIDVCRQLQDQYLGKIIILSARNDVIDQVLGLEIGADDYIPKPIEPRLLLAKCRAVLRREENATIPVVENKEATMIFSLFSINISKRQILKNGLSIDFSNPEYELLLLLVTKKGTIVSRDTISKQLRGVEYDGQSRQIDIHISSIRQKLGDNFQSPELIKTVRSKGYIFVG